MMRRQRVLPLVAVVLLFGSIRSFAGDVKIIANSSVKADVIPPAN